MADDVDFSISQFSGAWRLMCSNSPDYVTDGNGDVEYIFSGVPVPFFNVAIPTGRDISRDKLQQLARGQLDRGPHVAAESGLLHREFVFADRKEAQRVVAGIVGACRGARAGARVDDRHLGADDGRFLTVPDRAGDRRLLRLGESERDAREKQNSGSKTRACGLHSV